MSDVKEALEAAFDFLGGVDGASEIRDKLLRAMTAPAPSPAEALPSQTSGAVNKADAIIRQVRKFIAAENKYARLSEQGVNATRDDADFQHAQLVGDFTESDCDEALRVVARRRATLAKPASEAGGGGAREDEAVQACTEAGYNMSGWTVPKVIRSLAAIAKSETENARSAERKLVALSSPASSSPAEAAPSFDQIVERIQAEALQAGVVWFGFDESTGEFTGEWSTVEPSDPHSMIPFVRVSSAPAQEDGIDIRREAYMQGWRTALASLEDGVAKLNKAISRAEDGAGTLPAKGAVKLRPADWRAVCRLARALSDAGSDAEGRG